MPPRLRPYHANIFQGRADTTVLQARLRQLDDEHGVRVAYDRPCSISRGVCSLTRPHARLLQASSQLRRRPSCVCSHAILHHDSGSLAEYRRAGHAPYDVSESSPWPRGSDAATCRGDAWVHAQPIPREHVHTDGERGGWCDATTQTQPLSACARGRVYLCASAHRTPKAPSAVYHSSGLVSTAVPPDPVDDDEKDEDDEAVLHRLREGVIDRVAHLPDHRLVPVQATGVAWIGALRVSGCGFPRVFPL